MSDPAARVVSAVADHLNAEPVIREAFPDGAQKTGYGDALDAAGFIDASGAYRLSVTAYRGDDGFWPLTNSAISREPFEADLGGEAAEKMGATTGWWIVVSASVDEAVGVFTLAPSQPPPTTPT